LGEEEKRRREGSGRIYNVGGQALASGQAREHVIHVTAQVSVRRVKEGESVEMRLFEKFADSHSVRLIVWLVLSLQSKICHSWLELSAHQSPSPIAFSVPHPQLLSERG
jgi:hypothetical protein